MSILMIVILMSIIAIFWFISYVLDCYDEGYDILYVWKLLWEIVSNPGMHSIERKVASDLLEEYENDWNAHYLMEEA